MSKRDKIIEKIKALLNMTTDRGCSEAEAISCALKAQKLIAEYEIEKCEFYGEEPPRIIRSVVEYNTPSKLREHLAYVVSENFRCRFYTDHEPGWVTGKKTDQKHVVFVGYEQDALAASLVFERLYKVGNRLASRARREHPYVRDIYRAYFMNFIRGVKSELDKQCEALMLVRPLAVNEYYEDISQGFGKAPKTRAIIEYQNLEDVYDDAFRNGVEAVRESRMDGDTTYLIDSVA